MSTINSINPKNLNSSKYFLITIDVEDWFQVENFKPWIHFSTWNSRELRVERNVHRLLDLFDSIKLPLGTANPTNASNAINPKTPSATFFVLCWITRRLPHLVREIVARGHEVASHGCHHDLLTKIPLVRLKAELVESRLILEDTIGTSVFGFRAPSFAIDESILKRIVEAGYRYDSSYNSFRLHGRYGRISLNGGKKFGIAWRLSDGLYEIPISNLVMNGLRLPTGGGAYFRVTPFPIFRQAVKSILRRDNAYLFYLHPWEIDPDQPRLNEASLKIKLRHYSNLSKTEIKIDRLINSFPDCHFTSCTKYLNAAATAQ
jgi:polysaccharide deacetylase family protein (PEP-CTERM system associated)